MKKLFLTLFAAAVCLTACGPKTTYKYPFQDPSLKMEQRIENLLSLLTPEEKIGLLMNKSISVDSLGIPSYNWWSEACHGIRADGYTVYPQPVLLVPEHQHLPRPALGTRPGDPGRGPVPDLGHRPPDRPGHAAEDRQVL